MTDITKELNEQQAKAVTLSLSSNALILAGAGSGKTRVLTHRIAYILNESDTHVTQILALTFTNKAANEMKERLEALISQSLGFNTWVGTFHSIAHKILHNHSIQAGFSNTFSILDASEQLTKIKRIMKEMHIDDQKFKPINIASFINSSKDEGLHSGDIDNSNNIFTQVATEVFAVYENECKQSNELDFSEILLSTYELLVHNPDLLTLYQEQFKYMLVDEFQDTNTIQYKLITLLKHTGNTLFCVGDDDQSIYGWRGAKIENISNLGSDMDNFEIIKLEQNYRSSGNILAASNAVIANNSERMTKNLWTEVGNGELIDVFIGQNEKAEAKYIAQDIIAKKSINDDKEFAILYRNNALSRSIEEALISHNIAYSVYGGLRFFDREEIKHALAYLRLCCNTDDNAAFLRIVNTPARGISAATVAELTQHARNSGMSLFEAAKTNYFSMPTRKANAIEKFITLIEQLNNNGKNMSLSEYIQHIIHESGLYDLYQKDTSDKGRNKLQNLEELVGAAEDFVNNEPDMDDVLSFTTSVVLDSGTTNATYSNVNLTTIHSAKGLEFDIVYIVGVAEDIFPSMRSKDDGSLDEERRLFYVAMTRAKQKLTLSLVNRRFLYGHHFNEVPSRFIVEIPQQYLCRVHTQQSVAYASTKNFADNPSKRVLTTPYNEGDKVVHKKFGLGVVMNYEDGANPRVEVKFANFGSKWLILEYAQLEKLS